ncbi:MAG: hypothetical protein ACLFPF_03215 [Halanaerobiales bacterium]
MEINFIYEVETRFTFDSKEEAFEAVPFLKKSLNKEIVWKTSHYGLDLFKKDIILRLSRAEIGDKIIKSLGYKEKDIGEYLNIRKEYGEKITDGIKDSFIMDILHGERTFTSPDEVEDELNKLGYDIFMSFEGRSIIGKYQPLDLQLKLMYCQALKYPLLLEIEKEAHTYSEIQPMIIDIKDFIKRYNLADRVVQKEPPTLLYEVLKKTN